MLFCSRRASKKWFKQRNKARHLKPLSIKAYVNGKLMSRVLIDGGVVLNVMPFSTRRSWVEGKKISKK